MARIDKYQPEVGGFRARLGFQPTGAELGVPIAVTINASGLAVKAGAATAEGVICLSSLLNQGDVVDVMTGGELVDVADTNITGRAAGAEVFAGASGALTATAPAAGVNGTKIGRFVENWRLVVRVTRVQGA